MDPPRRSSFLPAFNLFVLAILLLRFPAVVHGSGVFRVKRKFGASTPIADLMRHDELRHARRLSARPLDIPLGGQLVMGQWYAEIAIGTPPRHFQLHIDTGSPVTWVDCEGCIGCPKSNAMVKVESYNPKLSKTARIVTGDESLCDDMLWGLDKNSSSGFCKFRVVYADHSVVDGYYVTDVVSFNQVSSSPAIGFANVTFGCLTRKYKDNMEQYLIQGTEGILGLSMSRHSILFQMASLGRVRKEFAHCLANEGGIFAIGHVVKPKVTTMTPLVQDGDGGHDYSISVTAIEVGVHSHIHQYSAIVDTGTLTIVLPKVAYDFVVEKVFLKHPKLREGVEKNPILWWFPIHGSVDAEFPILNFQVNMSQSLTLYPHDYLVHDGEKNWTLGIRTMGEEYFIIGDVVLRNRLFIYDLENMQLGWTDYNCSSSIELEEGDGVCNIGAHNITSYPHRTE